MALLKTVKPKTRSTNIAQLEREFKRAYADVAYDVLQDYQASTATWKNKPTFSVKTTRAGVEVSTTDQVFMWVDEGTPAHDIVASPGKVLVFGASTPKTRPGNIGSSAGSRGPRDRRANRVRHPGGEARRFSPIIADKRNKQLQRRIDGILKEFS